MSEDQLLARFQQSMIQQDLAEATIKGYLADMHHFYRWLQQIQEQSIPLTEVTSADLRAYRQYLVNIQRQKTAAVNRRIQALRRFFSWAKRTGLVKDNPAESIRFRRKSAPTQPVSLNPQEVHALLRVAGQSPQGMAKRNYALLQLMLQAGLRISEVCRLQYRDLQINERSGVVAIVDGKGQKERDVPLNATARRALSQYLPMHDHWQADDPVFTSKRNTPLSIRAAQKIIQSLVNRAKIERIAVSAHTLRHTFARRYLDANPGNLVELATLLGHDSLDTTAIYTKADKTTLAQAVERSELNIYD
jgi:site-specific recombinase XerD